MTQDNMLEEHRRVLRKQRDAVMSKPILNKEPKLPDLSAIVTDLQKEGYTLKQIADTIDVSVDTVVAFRDETTELRSIYFVVYKLIDLYLRKLGLPVPIYGNHN